MGWSYGFINGRDVGYGVPALCDHPDCSAKIDRGLDRLCGEMHGCDDETGCGLYFCSAHLAFGETDHQQCLRCVDDLDPFEPKPDIVEWITWKLTDASWAEWRKLNWQEVDRLKVVLVDG